MIEQSALRASFHAFESGFASQLSRTHEDTSILGGLQLAFRQRTTNRAYCNNLSEVDRRMNDSRLETTANRVAVSSQRPTVITNFTGYTPPFDVVPIVERMLASVPPKYLVGLSEVVLTNSSGLPRKLRRSVTKSRKRKVKVAEAAGLYHQAWQGNRAWIEIFVDNMMRALEASWWLKIAYVRESVLAGVLFHEIGHHIHATAHPEYRDKEDVADSWKLKLNRQYFRIQHPWVRIIAYPFRPLLRLVVRFLKSKLAR